MLSPTLALFSLVVFAFFANILPAEIEAQSLPSVQLFRYEMQMREFAQPETTQPTQPLGPPARRIATIATQADRGRREVRVFQKGQPVKLSRGFHQVVIVDPAGRRAGLEDLAGRSVAVVRSAKRAGRFEIYSGVGGVCEYCLAGNIFVVKQVVFSSRESPVEVQINGEALHLKPGQALLLM